VNLCVAEHLLAEADNGLMRVVFDNLLGNAWSSPRESLSLGLRLEQDQQQGETVFFVRDNGAGFDMSYGRESFPSVSNGFHNEVRFREQELGLHRAPRYRPARRTHLGEQCGRPGATFYFTIPPASWRPPVIRNRVILLWQTTQTT